MNIDPRKANKMETGQPVNGFPIKFTWHQHYWPDIFDRQIKIIRGDIARARAEDRLIIYLSCPISARGGGDSSTNVDIAKATERRLLDQWGEAFWILNPAQYQLESKEGTGLMEQHAKDCGIDLSELKTACTPPAPGGGDYMRMWTKVLVEDQGIYSFKDPACLAPELKNTGQHFDGYYFLGPNDIHQFFAQGSSETLTASIENHFARKLATDSDFADAFAIPGLTWSPTWQIDGKLSPVDKQKQVDLRAQWEVLRRKFLRFYALRASIAYSLGSHDEWEIFRQINIQRRAANASPGIPEQLGGFFEGKQIDPAAAEAVLSKGYAN